jgi:hypothetical protein
MTDEHAVVRWSAAGLPPAYVERRWRAEVPQRLRSGFDELIARVHFFDLAADLGANPPHGRDMGNYSITVDEGSRRHTVHYSDATVTQDLADLRRWIADNLQSIATPE